MLSSSLISTVLCGMVHILRTLKFGLGYVTVRIVGYLHFLFVIALIILFNVMIMAT